MSMTMLFMNRRTVGLVKSPKCATKEQMEFISEYFIEMIYACTDNEYNGKTVEEYIDLESLASVYAVNEYLKNCDYCASSTYFYLPDSGNAEYENKFYA